MGGLTSLLLITFLEPFDGTVLAGHERRVSRTTFMLFEWNFLSCFVFSRIIIFMGSLALIFKTTQLIGLNSTVGSVAFVALQLSVMLKNTYHSFFCIKKVVLDFYMYIPLTETTRFPT
ncbi:hypothetical protein ACJX0J_028294 [Zea mays]